MTQFLNRLAQVERKYRIWQWAAAALFAFAVAASGLAYYRLGVILDEHRTEAKARFNDECVERQALITGAELLLVVIQKTHGKDGVEASTHRTIMILKKQQEHCP